MFAVHLFVKKYNLLRLITSAWPRRKFRVFHSQLKYISCLCFAVLYTVFSYVMELENEPPFISRSFLVVPPFICPIVASLLAIVTIVICYLISVIHSFAPCNMFVSSQFLDGYTPWLLDITHYSKDVPAVFVFRIGIIPAVSIVKQCSRNAFNNLVTRHCLYLLSGLLLIIGWKLFHFLKLQFLLNNFQWSFAVKNGCVAFPPGWAH